VTRLKSTRYHLRSCAKDSLAYIHVLIDGSHVHVLSSRIVIVTNSIVHTPRQSHLAVTSGCYSWRRRNPLSLAKSFDSLGDISTCQPLHVLLRFPPHRHKPPDVASLCLPASQTHHAMGVRMSEREADSFLGVMKFSFVFSRTTSLFAENTIHF
jgi:hypothetical protein